MNTQVSVVRCSDYNDESVEKAARNSIKFIGGLGKIIKPEDKVLLKVNLLAPTEAEKAVTTHPAVVKATIKLVREAGGIPIVADSPGFLFAGGKNTALIRSGIKEIADELGAEALQFETVDNSFVEIV